MDPNLDNNQASEALYPFPDKIVIQDRVSATRYARHILDKDSTSTRTLERHLVMWVDGSVKSPPATKTNTLSAAATAYRDFASKEWQDSITINITQRGTGSSLEAEMLAVREAFLIACGLTDNFDSLQIFSDSQSILQSIRARTVFRSLWKNDIAHNILKYADLLYDLGISVELRWVPAHASIDGNKRVDKLARQSRKIAEPFLAQIPRDVILKDITITSSSLAKLTQVLPSQINRQWGYGDKNTGLKRMRTSLLVDRDPTPNKLARKS